MTEKPITNPSIPYVGLLGSQFTPGKFVRVLGVVSSFGKGFFCNLQCGPNNFDDIALQLLVQLVEGTIVIKSQQHGIWLEENTYENLEIRPRTPFEILVICEPTVFKIGINGQHLCEFPHKVPYYRISHIKVDGNVSISQISVENQATTLSSPAKSSVMDAAPPPYPAGETPYPATGAPYPPNAAPYPPTAAPYPPTTAPYPGPPQTMPAQGAYPLNSGAHTVMYTNQNVPPGNYPYNPLVQQQGVITTGALNATPRPYQAPYWQRSFGYRGSRKTAYIICGIYTLFTLLILIAILSVFLAIYKKAERDFEERARF